MSTRPRPSRATRRFGYLLGALVNAVLLYLIHVRPGWQALPFLTGDTVQVLALVDASIAAGLAANLVYLVKDDPWVRALGDLVTTGVGLAALARIWTVYPFDFGDSDLPWDLLTRTVLVLALVGSAIGVLVAVVTLVRDLGRTAAPPADDTTSTPDSTPTRPRS
jgi:hypothetical protein